MLQTGARMHEYIQETATHSVALSLRNKEGEEFCADYSAGPSPGSHPHSQRSSVMYSPPHHCKSVLLYIQIHV